MIAAIPTSQRPEMCQSVANQLTQFKHVGIFVNNCEFSSYKQLSWNDNVILFDCTDIVGTGAQAHNLTFRRMIKNLSHDDDVLFIEDDIVLSDVFHAKFIAVFNHLKKTQKGFSFSPIYIPEKKCKYTPAPAISRKKISGVYIQNQAYIDGNFAVPASVISVFKKANKELAFPVKKANSGISPVLSVTMYHARFPMLVAVPSMIGHGDHDSLQFPEGRKRVPLIAKI